MDAENARNVLFAGDKGVSVYIMVGMRVGIQGLGVDMLAVMYAM